jgi:hypothetical protein
LSGEITALKSQMQQNAHSLQSGMSSSSSARQHLAQSSQAHIKKEESDDSRSSSAYIVRDSDLNDNSNNSSKEQLDQRPHRPSSVASNPGHFVSPLGAGGNLPNPMAAAMAFMATRQPQTMMPPFRFPFAQPPPINPMAAAAFMQHLEQQRAANNLSPAPVSADMTQMQQMMYRMPPPASFMIPPQQFASQQQQQFQPGVRQEPSENGQLSSASRVSMSGHHSDQQQQQLYNNSNVNNQGELFLYTVFK